MCLKASLAALAGVAWMASAAAVPRLDNVFATTCTSTAAEETSGVEPESTCSSLTLQHMATVISNSTCSSTAAAEATASASRSSPIQTATLTITSSTPCFSSNAASVITGPHSANSSLGLPTVQPGSNSSSCGSSETAAPVGLSTTDISAPRTATVTEFTALATTTVSAAATTTTSQMVSATTVKSVVTSTGSGDSSEYTVFDSDATTATSVSQPTPETTTRTPLDEDVTVTVYTSSTSTVLFTPNCSCSSGAATGGGRTSPSDGTTTVAVAASSASKVYRPYALTYTLSPDSVFPTPFTGTITVTPLPPAANRVDSSNPSPINSATGSSTRLSTFPTPSSPGAPSPPGSVLPASTVAHTVTTQESLSAYTSIPTVTDSASTISPSVIVTVVTPIPIDPTTTVPLIPLTVTFTISDPTLPITNPTLSLSVFKNTSQATGPSSAPSNERPDRATITVTTVATSASAHPASNPTALSSGVHSPFVSAAAPAPISPSNGGLATYGSATVASLSTTVLSPVTSAASSMSGEGPESRSLTILTISVSEASGYGFVPSADGVTAPTDNGEGSTVTVTKAVTSPTSSLVAPGSNQSSLVTVTAPPLGTVPTRSPPLVSASAPFSNSTASVIFVTYTVPGEYGIGASTYTVPYTVQPSTTRDGAPGGGTGTLHTKASQTSGPSNFTTKVPESPLTVSPTSRAPFTLTVTLVTSGTHITTASTSRQTKASTSSTSSAPQSFTSSAESLSSTREASEYGASQSSLSDGSYGGPSDATSTFAHSADLPVVRTTPNAIGVTTTPNHQSIGMTATTSTRCVATSVFPTSEPSTSSAAVTFSGSPSMSTDGGEYQTATTAAVLPTSASAQSTVGTLTGDVSSVKASAAVSTAVVSLVTLTKTVPIGYGSSTVVKFTTEVTVGLVPGSQTAPCLASLITPASPLSSSSEVSPPRSTSSMDEMSSADALSSSRGPPFANGTSTRPAQTSVVVTVLPSATSPSSLGSAVTPKPGSTTELLPASSVSTCTSTEDSAPISVSGQDSSMQPTRTTSSQPNNPTPSEVTNCPSPAMNSSCSTTFSTSYRPSNASLALSTSTKPLLSVTTLPPAPASSTLRSSPCTETLSGSSVAIATNIPPTGTPHSKALPDSEPQADFRHHARAATDSWTDIATSTFGGYVFSKADASYTAVAKTETASTTSSAVPVPIVTSLPSRDELTSSVILFLGDSSVPGNVTVSSLSSRRVSTSTKLLSSVPHITFTFSPTPAPTTATTSLSTEGSSTEAPSPIIVSLTLTVTTTIITDSVPQRSSAPFLGSSTLTSTLGSSSAAVNQTAPSSSDVPLSSVSRTESVPTSRRSTVR